MNIPKETWNFAEINATQAQLCELWQEPGQESR